MVGNLVSVTLKTGSFKKCVCLPSITSLIDAHITTDMVIVLQNIHNSVRKSINFSDTIFTERCKK